MASKASRRNALSGTWTEEKLYVRALEFMCSVYIIGKMWKELQAFKKAQLVRVTSMINELNEPDPPADKVTLLADLKAFQVYFSLADNDDGSAGKRKMDDEEREDAVLRLAAEQANKPNYEGSNPVTALNRLGDDVRLVTAYLTREIGRQTFSEDHQQMIQNFIRANIRMDNLSDLNFDDAPFSPEIKAIRAMYKYYKSSRSYKLQNDAEDNSTLDNILKKLFPPRLRF